jgi:CcmD family protein
MNSFIKKITLLAALLFSVSTYAQNAPAPIEMADGMIQSGKIYVVVAVLTAIFIGFITYLVLLDKKISKLEKEINTK